MKIPALLTDILASKPIFIGIGNELRGDDATGIALVNKLIESGYRNAIIVHSNPENYLNKIATMSGNCRVWVDIINWGAEAGEIRILPAEESKQFAISTHNFSPDVLFEFLKSSKKIPDYILGIQPLTLKLGSKISPVVENTINIMADFILKNI
jgi:hydrogenase 3 maturation protease